MPANSASSKCRKNIEAILAILTAVASLVACGMSAYSLQQLKEETKDEVSTRRGINMQDTRFAADYIAVIASPFSVLICTIYAIVRLLENTRAAENLLDMTIRITSLVIGGLLVAAFGVAGGLGISAAHKWITYGIGTLVSSLIAFVIGVIFKSYELILFVRKLLLRSHSQTPDYL